ncbi:hypothetical protein OH764_00695 [Burkholderia sp. M6-3]
MEGSVMDGVKDALLGLRAKSKTGRLRELLPIIEAKVEEGVRHEDIHTVLNQLGLSMSLEVYKTTLYRIRKERAETCKTIVSQVLPGSTRGNAAISPTEHAPTALPKQSTTPIGSVAPASFDWESERGKKVEW